MIFSSQERKDLYKALAMVEEVVMDNIDMWEQKLIDYKIWIEYTDEDEVKIVVGEIPNSMTVLQALYLAEKLITVALEADKMKKLKKWLDEREI
jgi:hypothetical protein